MRHKYGKNDDELIAFYLYLHKDRRIAFRSAAESLEVTEKSVASRYYRHRDSIEKMAHTYDEPPQREPWYARLWKSVKNMLDISKFI